MYFSYQIHVTFSPLLGNVWVRVRDIFLLWYKQTMRTENAQCISYYQITANIEYDTTIGFNETYSRLESQMVKAALGLNSIHYVAVCRQTVSALLVIFEKCPFLDTICEKKNSAFLYSCSFFIYKSIFGNILCVFVHHFVHVGEG
jgi:hypothetical protein